MRYFRILHVINDIQERALNNYPQLTIWLKPDKPLAPQVKLFGMNFLGAHLWVWTQDLFEVPGSQNGLYPPAITPGFSFDNLAFN
jgi:hypothetical protein